MVKEEDEWEKLDLSEMFEMPFLLKSITSIPFYFKRKPKLRVVHHKLGKLEIVDASASI